MNASQIHSNDDEDDEYRLTRVVGSSQLVRKVAPTKRATFGKVIFDARLWRKTRSQEQILVPLLIQVNAWNLGIGMDNTARLSRTF